MPVALAGWAATLDLVAVPDALALNVRTFLHRAASLDPQVRVMTAQRLATQMAGHVRNPAPPGTPAEAYLTAVLAERTRRSFAAGTAPDRTIPQESPTAFPPPATRPSSPPPSTPPCRCPPLTIPEWTAMPLLGPMGEIAGSWPRWCRQGHSQILRCNLELPFGYLQGRLFPRVRIPSCSRNGFGWKETVYFLNLKN